MKTISKEILDNIVEQLCEGVTDSSYRTYANYEDDDILIDASVLWHIASSPNYITIDGCSYLEGIYTEVTGFSDLSVDAYVGDEQVDVYDYIEQNLYY